MFDAALAFVLGEEGGFVDDKDDPGGATNFGITQLRYTAWLQLKRREPAKVEDIPPADVRAFYGAEWRACQGERLTSLGLSRLAIAVLDWHVNAGGGRTVPYIQLAVGVKPDGTWGALTQLALEQLGTREGWAIANHCTFRAWHYRARAGDTIALRRLRDAGLPPHLCPKPNAMQHKFLNGWLARLRHLARATDVGIGVLFAKGSEAKTIQEIEGGAA